ncbi:MAG: efflux RND transporter periplasmic adaptor subunit [Reichenbachiella sp.]|uniref:efflux RND transporter periplasmic adaptor subunit n=1 Tax=Reichenbachiella sp. TaxID=2184521 RepID=UPI0032973A86
MNLLRSHIYPLILLSIILFACKADNEEDKTIGISPSNEINISKKQFETAAMKLGTLSLREVAQTTSTRGYIDVPPENRAAVSPYYSGYINAINILPGQFVKKGQILFTLQHPDYLKIQQSYLEAKEQLTYLKADYERQFSLADEQIASQKSFRKAESDYKVMQARYLGLQEQLKLMNVSIPKLNQGQMTHTINIYAPIDGYITQVRVTKSAYVNSSEVALEIVNTDHLHLELEIFEKDLGKIKEGQKINFSVPESGKKRFNGEVYLVGRKVDDKQRTIAIHGHIDEALAEDFIPGMYVEAQIIVQSDSLFCLPKSAIVEGEEKNYVLVKNHLKNGVLQFNQQEVVLGRESNLWIEVKNKEVLKNKQLLIEGAFGLIGI